MKFPCHCGHSFEVHGTVGRDANHRKISLPTCGLCLCLGYVPRTGRPVLRVLKGGKAAES